MSGAGPSRKVQLSETEQRNRACAIDPGASVFLAANAGSGKTTILTQRVIRLLLDGTPPERILCVTYTRAAAAEMQNRIFTELADWVRLDEAELAHRIADLTGAPPDTDCRARARQLFARAVETPGGLKLQTIHAFAERLLHLFPFEANVPARFAVMDDFAGAEISATARRDSLAAGLASPDSEHGRALADLINLMGENALSELIAAGFPLIRRARLQPATTEALAIRVKRLLGLGASETPSGLAAAFLEQGLARHLWPKAESSVGARASTPTDRAFVTMLHEAAAKPDDVAAVDRLADLFVTGKGTLRDKIVTKAIAEALPWLAEAIGQTKARLPAYLDRQRAFAVARWSAALMQVLADILSRFQAAKRRAALVDFDDIIERTRFLVAGHGSAWVLRKLDGGIDHLLIDEAQDTTPAMWQIAEALTAEFFAGDGARSLRRTVFAVGDEKQSIYSFQGAEPKEFYNSRIKLQNAAEAAGLPFHALPLTSSFRTVADVLDAVDRVFAMPAHFDGLTALPEPTLHETVRKQEPGLVEIWPLEHVASSRPEDPWQEIDALGARSSPAVLAERLAGHIATLCAGERFADDGRRIRPGDVLVLVQRRDAFVGALIRALKRKGLPVAGADRMRLTEQAAVLDLIAAARATLLPEDDLTLATALKSPLIGLTDDDLISLCAGRPGSLVEALEMSGEARFTEAFAILTDWRRLASSETPFGFFSAILTPMGGRLKLMSRLGPEASEGIDLFLEQVLARQSRAPASLAGEIEAFERLTTDVKREQDQAGGAVRILTVHGAKGLEARIVYLADPQRLPVSQKDKPVFLVPDGPDDTGLLLWSRALKSAPGLVRTLAEKRRQERMQEYRRQLYVAMTRARDRLYVAGWGDPAKLKSDSWYAMIQTGLKPAGILIREDDGREIVRFVSVTTPPAAPAEEPEPSRQDAEQRPDWVDRPALPETVPAPPLKPSRLLAAIDQVDTPERRAARERGDLVHALF
ncbi:MAG TPA: double-strand break repair helicase AddA, partial [Beijerinckiaceae bacterium]|nr:double-strand break repair helicase AddA [Beijerinckiaceae bacterium]